jgi:hypothetical protein
MFQSLFVVVTDPDMKRREQAAAFKLIGDARRATTAAGAIVMDSGGRLFTPPSSPVRMTPSASRRSPRDTAHKTTDAATRREAASAADQVRRSWRQTNYDHKLYCHAWELLLRYGSIGAYSSQFLEAGNKWWKRWATTSAAVTKQWASVKAMNKYLLTTNLGVRACGVVKKTRKIKTRAASAGV